MSNTQFAFIKKSKIPTKDALQASIDALGFDLKLDPELDFLRDTGFSPCVLNGVPDVGFELFVESASDVVEDDEEFQGIAGDNDLCICMSWGGSMKDCASVMIVCCALQKDFDAVISYEGEPPDEFQELLTATQGIVEDSQNED